MTLEGEGDGQSMLSPSRGGGTEVTRGTAQPPPWGGLPNCPPPLEAVLPV